MNKNERRLGRKTRNLRTIKLLAVQSWLPEKGNIMRDNKLKFLNEPFVLWFLSSVVIAFISWQYAEVQKNSAEQKVQKQVLKKARLELNLLLQDIELFASLKEKTTAQHLTGTITLMQYNALDKTNQFYVPTLQNVMLEIDSRTDAKGLEKFQRRIFDHLKVVSLSTYRVIYQTTQPNDVIWNRLSIEEKKNLESLVILAKEIADYYKTHAEDS